MERSTSLMGVLAFEETVAVNCTVCPDTVSELPSMDTETGEELKVAWYPEDATKMALEPWRRYSSSTFTSAMSPVAPANIAETVPWRTPPASMVPSEMRWFVRSDARLVGERVPDGYVMTRSASSSGA